MIFFPREWITHPDDVRERVRVQLPDRPPPTVKGDAATGTAGPSASLPIPSEPFGPVPAPGHGAAFVS